jgi:hypothetical protein
VVVATNNEIKRKQLVFTHLWHVKKHLAVIDSHHHYEGTGNAGGAVLTTWRCGNRKKRLGFEPSACHYQLLWLIAKSNLSKSKRNHTGSETELNRFTDLGRLRRPPSVFSQRHSHLFKRVDKAKGEL